MDKPCKTIIFTQSDQSLLASYGGAAFFTGQTSHPHYAGFMLVQAFIGEICAEREKWKKLPMLLSALREFPKALISAAQQLEQRGKELAARYKQGDQLYFVGSGPGKLVPCSYGLCLLEEKLKISIRPVNADQFFHSTLEIATKDARSHFILILAEDDSRPQMERVAAFVGRFGGSVEILDTKDYAMEGINPEIHPNVAPYIAARFLSF